MSAFKGTPGPWALQMAEDCPGRQLDEMVKWVVTANAHDMWVSTGPTWDAEHDAEALANAHLIAAAPDLLTFTGDMRQWLRETLDAKNSGLNSAERAAAEAAYTYAESVIAKATGEQS